MTKVRSHIDNIDTTRTTHHLATISTDLGRRKDLLPSHVVLKMLQNQLGSTATATVRFKASAKWLLSRLLQALLAHSARSKRCW